MQDAFAPASGAASPMTAAHPRVAFGKVGVLLVNLGTPEGTDYRSMRRYLAVQYQVLTLQQMSFALRNGEMHDLTRRLLMKI